MTDSAGAPIDLDRHPRAPLTATDWRLLAAVAVMQVLAACALRLMPLGTLRTRARRTRRLARWTARGSDARLVWAIEATGRRLGWMSTCLVRAVVAELVLRSPGRPLHLTIGVKRGADGVLAAHAWVGSDDRILVGATDDRFAPLVEWSDASR